MRVREHGKRSCYRAGCRLPECRKANSDYIASRRKKFATAIPVTQGDGHVKEGSRSFTFTYAELMRARSSDSSAKEQVRHHQLGGTA